MPCIPKPSQPANTYEDTTIYVTWQRQTQEFVEHYEIDVTHDGVTQISFSTLKPVTEFAIGNLIPGCRYIIDVKALAGVHDNETNEPGAVTKPGQCVAYTSMYYILR